MKKYFVAIAMCILVLCNQHVNAQTVTKYNDEVATLDGIMKAYYDVVTVKKGEKVSYERDSLLHIADAQVGSPSIDRDGNVVLHMMSLREYHKLSDEYLERYGFNEREIDRKVEKFGSIYHVWSTYESRYTTPDGQVVDRGINSIELFFDGTRFWIISWVFDKETKSNTLPFKY